MDKKLIIVSIAAVILIGAIVYFIVLHEPNEHKPMEVLKDANEANFKKSIETLKNEGYSDEVLRDVEKIFRLETNHFKSGQFKYTYSAGMEVHGSPRRGNLVFGWDIRHFANNSKLPNDYIEMPENQTGIKKKFIKFNTLTDSVRTLANYINKYKNPARWYSTEPTQQAEYLNKLSNIKTLYA